MTFNIDSCRKPLQNCFKTYKYCDNTREYCTCRWPHFSSIGSILVSITTILTSIVTILASIEQVNTPIVGPLGHFIMYYPPFPHTVVLSWKLKGCEFFMKFFSWKIVYSATHTLSHIKLHICIIYFFLKYLDNPWEITGCRISRT